MMRTLDLDVPETLAAKILAPKTVVGTLTVALVLGTAATVGPARAADPIVGDWVVEDQSARVTVDICNGAAWGIVSWEKEPGIDRQNPDAAKRSRPTMGIPIILGMKPNDRSIWDGQIYNAENGKTYDAHLSMRDGDTMRVEGCILGFLCGGQNWTRYRATTDSKGKPAAKPAAAPAARPGRPSGTSGSAVCDVVAKLNAPTR